MTLLRDDLIGQNRNQDRNADDIRQGPDGSSSDRSHADQTEHNVQLLEHEANQAGGDEEHTHRGGKDTCTTSSGPKSPMNQHRVIESKDVGTMKAAMARRVALKPSS